MRERIISLVIVLSFLVVIPLMTYDLWGESALAGVVMQKVNTYRLNQGLVGWWTFDGTDVNWTTGRVSDKSGNNKYGTIIGMATATAPIAGKIGQALQFDGVDDNVDVSNFSTVTASPFTWSFWYKGKGGSAEDIISLGFYRYCGSNIGGNFRCTVDGDAYNGVSASDSLVSDGNWHLISYVYTNDSLSELYVDGVQTDSGANTAATAGVSSVSFGYNPGGAFGAAALDDVRIYNRALSASEVKLLYTTTAGSKVNTSRNVIPGSTLQTGLVGLWSFDGPDLDFRTNRAIDRSGQGHNGEMVNMSTSTSRVAGKVGQALRFDGVNDRVDLSTGLPTVNDFTISGWMKLETGATPGNHYALFKCGSCSSDTRIMPHVNEGGYLTVNGTLSPSMNGLTVNEWAFIVVTRNGSTANYYRDGNLETSWSSGSTALDLADSNIGADYLSYYVRGILDDVRIYNRALSASEVKDLYTATAGTKVNTSQNVVPGSSLQNGLVGLWSFNGLDVTDKVYDRSGNNNNGYFVGGATSSAKTGGKVGQALRFDGVDDEVDFPSQFVGLDSSSASTFTWAWWQKTSSSLGQMFGWSPWRWCTMGFMSGHVACTVDSDANGGVISTTLLDDNAWHHIVFSHSPGVQKLYVDGIQESNASETFTTGDDFISIGSRPYGVNWAGTLDEVRVYNRVLTPAEVKLLYNLGR